MPRLGYVLRVGLALTSTLYSLAHHDIDGVNILYQYALAQPWLYLLELLPAPQSP